MMTLPLGPLALPTAPLLLLVVLLLTVWAVRRQAVPEEREAAETAVWWALAAGLGVARLAHGLSHLEAYAASPIDILDIRDGGFLPWAGIPAGLAVLSWRLRRSLQVSRRPVLISALVGLVVWVLAKTLLPVFDPYRNQTLASLGVRLQALGEPEPAGLTLQEIAARQGGRPVVLNLWATWCGPCRAEMPVLAQAQRDHPQVLFVFANQGEADPAIQAFLVRERLTLAEVWRDPASALGPALGSGGLPTTVVFDAQGRRQAAHMGALNAAGLRAMLKTAQALP